MNIVSSEIVHEKPYGTTSIKVKERHVDIVGKIYTRTYIADIGHDTAAALAQYALDLSEQLIDQESETAIQVFYDGGDPLHEDLGGFWGKMTPVYQTWEELAESSTKYYLASPNQLDLLYIQHTSRISSKDKKVIWGMTNPEVSDVNGDIQIAVDTSNSLASYTPYFDEDGTKL